jgi:hypothetical protein
VARAVHITNTDRAAFTSRCALHFQQMLSENDRILDSSDAAVGASAITESHSCRPDHDGICRVALTPNSLVRAHSLIQRRDHP